MLRSWPLAAALMIAAALTASAQPEAATDPAVESFEQTQPPEVTFPDEESSANQPPSGKKSAIDFDKLYRNMPGGEEYEEESTDAGQRELGPLETFARVIGGLAFVLALILLLYAAVRKWGKHTPLLSGMQYGQVLGRVHLTPRASLHLVRMGGRVLVVGVTPSDLSLIAEFDEDVFADLLERKGNSKSPVQPDGGEAGTQGAITDFFSHLTQRADKHETDRAPIPGSDIDVQEDDIAALRGDIQRLQQYLRESAHEDSER